MARTITYIGGGPEVVDLGGAGRFTRGVPVPVDDDPVAAQLLAKTSLVFRDDTPAPKGKAQQTQTMEE